MSQREWSPREAVRHGQEARMVFSREENIISYGSVASSLNLARNGDVGFIDWLGSGPRCSMMRRTRANKPDSYLLGSYLIATAPEPNSSRLTSFKSTGFDSPANKVGPWPASLGCTMNSYSSINPSSVNACGSFTPPTNSPLPDSCLSC